MLPFHASVLLGNPLSFVTRLFWSLRILALSLGKQVSTLKQNSKSNGVERILKTRQIFNRKKTLMERAFRKQSPAPDRGRQGRAKSSLDAVE